MTVNITGDDVELTCTMQCAPGCGLWSGTTTLHPAIQSFEEVGGVAIICRCVCVSVCVCTVCVFRTNPRLGPVAELPKLTSKVQKATHEHTERSVVFLS